MPKTLERFFARHKDVIAGVSDETGFGDGYWISLKDGFCDANNPQCHTIHEWTVKDLIQAFSVVRCTCRECKQEGSK